MVQTAMSTSGGPVDLCLDPCLERDVMPEDNSHAGQGAVLLNIGGDIGALVVTMPAAMEGIEVEIRPVGAPDTAPDAGHEHANGHDQADGHDHAEGHAHSHGHAHDHSSPWPHVAVVARPAPAGIVHSLVYSELQEGSYELYVRPHGPVELTVDVTGGHVTEAAWPS
jgi:hypothetical protein